MRSIAEKVLVPGFRGWQAGKDFPAVDAYTCRFAVQAIGRIQCN
jgi:hypothetical protein